jgi:hypothetical protein
MKHNRRRITVTSSFNKISTDQLGNRVPPPFLQLALEQIFKDDVNCFLGYLLLFAVNPSIRRSMNTAKIACFYINIAPGNICLKKTIAQ